MTKHDRGVHGNLLNRKFGSAGTGADLTRHAAAAERADALRKQREDNEKLKKMQAAKPLKPPGRK